VASKAFISIRFVKLGKPYMYPVRVEISQEITIA